MVFSAFTSPVAIEWREIATKNDLQDKRQKMVDRRIDCSSVCEYLLIYIQVIAGAGMDVDFTVFSPEGIQLIMESRRSDGVHVLVRHSIFHIIDPHWGYLYINLSPSLCINTEWSLLTRETIESASTTASVASRRRWCSLRLSWRVKEEMWLEKRSGPV